MNVRIVILGLTLILISCNQNNVHNTSKTIDSIQNKTNTINDTIDNNVSGLSSNDNLKELSWSELYCDYTGKYDSTLVTLEQLKNSLDLGFSLSGKFMIQTNISANNVDEINELNISELDNEYSSKIKDLETFQYIQTPYWQELKKQKINELRKMWEISRLAVLSYTYPDTLKSMNYQNECNKYAQAIACGGYELLKTWAELNEEMCKKNGNPEKVRNDFLIKSNSTDKLRYAHMDVITYGWWNCVIQNVPQFNNQNFHEEFIKSFVEIKKRCDEP